MNGVSPPASSSTTYRRQRGQLCLPNTTSGTCSPVQNAMSCCAPIGSDGGRASSAVAAAWPTLANAELSESEEAQDEVAEPEDQDSAVESADCLCVESHDDPTASVSPCEYCLQVHSQRKCMSCEDVAVFRTRRRLPSCLTWPDAGARARASRTRPRSACGCKTRACRQVWSPRSMAPTPASAACGLAWRHCAAVAVRRSRCSSSPLPEGDGGDQLALGLFLAPP